MQPMLHDTVTRTPVENLSANHTTMSDEQEVVAAEVPTEQPALEAVEEVSETEAATPAEEEVV